ncbi:hypothetical protein A3Q56_01184 [Intoshia linei]|uniref:Nuclear receptor domain-containing protein n=1 Tax=Intoshia linei TaxID=1819745 RepID=A0A177BA07_9BILA|nr:hypothetical protein A3Q56_01184 [Intoshia linei]
MNIKCTSECKICTSSEKIIKAFGGFGCQPCRDFFFRYKNFIGPLYCQTNQNCFKRINRGCVHCRFNLCLENGMQRTRKNVDPTIYTNIVSQTHQELFIYEEKCEHYCNSNDYDINNFEKILLHESIHYISAIHDWFMTKLNKSIINVDVEFTQRLNTYAYPRLIIFLFAYHSKNIIQNKDNPFITLSFKKDFYLKDAQNNGTKSFIVMLLSVADNIARVNLTIDESFTICKLIMYQYCNFYILAIPAKWS